MTNQTMGALIAARRRELGLTQKELADRLHLTDKAVSKWERDQAFPDTGTIPKLAELLNLTVEELMTARGTPVLGHRGAGYFFDLVLRVLPMALGAALTVTALLGELDLKSGFSMAGLALFCLGLGQLQEK